MAVGEFLCKQCGKEFETILKDENNNYTYECPYCGTEDVKRIDSKKKSKGKKEK
jgi:putative FmdB family regulatory protein